jgi:hypothetical protein
VVVYLIDDLPTSIMPYDDTEVETHVHVQSLNNADEIGVRDILGDRYQSLRLKLAK